MLVQGARSPTRRVYNRGCGPQKIETKEKWCVDRSYHLRFRFRGSRLERDDSDHLIDVVSTTP